MDKSGAFSSSTKERFEIGRADEVSLSIGGSFNASQAGALSIGESGNNG